MHDHRATPPPATPEELLDRWLDALNDPNWSTPPTPPPEIEEIGMIARQYQQALGAPTATRNTVAERNGSMNHALPPLPSPADPWRTVTPLRNRKTDRKGSGISWLTNGLATAMVIALLLALGGAMILQQMGLPGGSDDPTALPGIGGRPGATQEAGSLDCASPGYRAVVEGEVDPDALSAVGITDDPIVIAEDGITVPLPDDGELTLPAPSLLDPDSGTAVTIHEDLSQTITRVSDGETWEIPAAEPRQEGYSEGKRSSRYYISPYNDAYTDWFIVDVLTGVTRTTADILGQPFDGQLTAYNLKESANGSVLIVEFLQTVVGNETPEPNVANPGLLVIPGTLDSAYFQTFDSEYPITLPHISPEGGWLATDTGLFETSTGDEIADLSNLSDSRPTVVGFVSEVPSILMKTFASILIVTPTTVEQEITYQADDLIRTGVYSEIAQALVFTTSQSGSENWTWMNAVTGETRKLPELDGYALDGSMAFDPFALVETTASFLQYTDDPSPSHALRAIDMVSGNVSTAVENVKPDSINVWHYLSRSWLNDYVIVQDASGNFIVISPVDDTQLVLPSPDVAAPPEGISLSLGLSPNGGCLLAVAYVDDAVSSSFVAPVKTGTEWAELDVQLVGWFPVKEPATETLPAQEIASPAATPTN